MKTTKDKAVYDVFNEYFAHIDDPRQAHKIDHLVKRGFIHKRPGSHCRG